MEDWRCSGDARNPSGLETLVDGEGAGDPRVWLAPVQPPPHAASSSSSSSPDYGDAVHSPWCPSTGSFQGERTTPAPLCDNYQVSVHLYLEFNVSCPIKPNCYFYFLSCFFC